MTTFHCACCGLTCQTSRAYKIHLKSSRHLTRESTKLDYVCTCKKSFSTSSALYRHRKKCHSYQTRNSNNETSAETNAESNTTTHETNNVNLEKMEELLETLVEKKYGNTFKTLKQKDEEIAKLRREKAEENKKKEDEIREVIREKDEQIKLLLAEKNTTNNIETQNNVIVINNFGEESIDHISIQEILQMINDKPARSPVLLAQKIHFDSEHPENSNVSITGEKSNYAYIQKEGKKKRDYRKKIINEMTQNSFDIIERTYDDNVNVFSHSKQTGVENLKNRFYNNDIKYLTDEMDLMVLNESTEVKPKA